MVYSDEDLSSKIFGLQQEIQKWAEAKNLWTDSGFKTFLEHHQEEPSESTACVLVLWTENGLWSIFNGYASSDLLDEFDDFIETLGFYRELYSSCIAHFYPIDDELNAAYVKYFHWQWLTTLIKPNYTKLYHEIFSYFSRNPNRFYNLHHRSFEILISEIFSNQGYRSEVGSGQGDGGVDVKLYYKDGVDQTVTFVQIKKYKDTLPVKLEAVAALSGIVHSNNVDQGIFVTCSRYLPVAKRFADLKNSKIVLKDSSDVQIWCENVSKIMIRDRSNLLSNENLLKIIGSARKIDNIGRIITCTWGVGMVLNDFCIILKDEPELALVMRIGKTKRDYIDSPYNTIGYEIPIIDQSIIASNKKENIFRAKKVTNMGNHIYFLFDGNWYNFWDGAPKHFNLID